MGISHTGGAQHWRVWFVHSALMGMRCFALTSLCHALDSIRASRGCARRRDPLLPGIQPEGARTGRIVLLAGVDEPSTPTLMRTPRVMHGSNRVMIRWAMFLMMGAYAE